MKIDNSGKPLGATLTRSSDAKAPARSSNSADETTEAPAGDSVTLDAFNPRLQQLESTLSNQPVIDESRVAEIRKAITEGKFSVRADAIADKLMASVKELLSDKH